MVSTKVTKATFQTSCQSRSCERDAQASITAVTKPQDRGSGSRLKRGAIPFIWPALGRGLAQHGTLEHSAGGLLHSNRTSGHCQPQEEPWQGRSPCGGDRALGSDHGSLDHGCLDPQPGLSPGDLAQLDRGAGTQEFQSPQETLTQEG